MKPGTTESYLERIDRVVDYLGDQVESAPSLEAMADVAAISPFHFHRVYRAVTGETPATTLRRLRLVKACALLRDANNPITQIAFDIGYDSPQSFAKAFRTVTGFTPSQLRDDPASLEKTMDRLSTSASTMDAIGKVDVKVVSLDPFSVIASRHTGPHKELFQAFGELFDWATRAGHQHRLQGIYGIPVDDPRDIPNPDCRFDCCFDFGPGVSSDGKFVEFELGGGQFAVARHVGPYEGIEQKYDFLFGPWISQSGFSLRDLPVFNHYLKDPDTVPPEEWETDLYVPIQSKAE